MSPVSLSRVSLVVLCVACWLVVFVVVDLLACCVAVGCWLLLLISLGYFICTDEEQNATTAGLACLITTEGLSRNA